MKAVIIWSILAVATAGVRKPSLQQSSNGPLSELFENGFNALLPQLSLVLVGDFALAEGNITGVTIRGADQGHVKGHEKHGENDVTLTYTNGHPVIITVKGSYSLENAVVGGVSISGTGNFNVQVGHVEAVTTLTCESPEVKPHVVASTGLSLTFHDLKVSFENVAGGDETNQALELVLGEWLTSLAQDHSEQISDFIIVVSNGIAGRSLSH